MDWGDREHIKHAVLSPEEHCQFKFLAHAEGKSSPQALVFLQTDSRASRLGVLWEIKVPPAVSFCDHCECFVEILGLLFLI